MHYINTSLPKDATPTEIDGSALPAKEIHDRLMNLEHLRFGRLCFFLQKRHPDAVIGHSILIYRLSDYEVTVAESAPLPDLEAAAVAQK